MTSTEFGYIADSVQLPKAVHQTAPHDTKTVQAVEVNASPIQGSQGSDSEEPPSASKEIKPANTASDSSAPLPQGAVETASQSHESEELAPDVEQANQSDPPRIDSGGRTAPQFSGVGQGENPAEETVPISPEEAAQSVPRIESPATGPKQPQSAPSAPSEGQISRRGGPKIASVRDGSPSSQDENLLTTDRCPPGMSCQVIISSFPSYIVCFNETGLQCWIAFISTIICANRTPAHYYQIAAADFCLCSWILISVRV